MGLNEDLSDQHVIPISSLSPPAIPNASASLRAVIALVFPYSSATKSAAFLIAESDFRLRRNKGQVRVQLHGSAAKAVATSGIGVGDTVVLSLAGARWAKDVPPISTPGRSVDGELIFANQLGLEVRRNDQQFASIAINEPEPEDEVEIIESSRQSNIPATPAQKSNLDSPRTGVSWDSPLFLHSSQPFRADPYDPFALDDGGSPGKGRKRTRFSGAWTYARSSAGESQDSRSSRDGSDREGEGDRNHEETAPSDTQAKANKRYYLNAEFMVEPSSKTTKQQEVEELEAGVSQQTMGTDTQRGYNDQMMVDAEMVSLLSSPLEPSTDRSRIEETSTPITQVWTDSNVLERRPVLEDPAFRGSDARSPETESPFVSQNISGAEYSGEVYSEADPNLEQVLQSAPVGLTEHHTQDEDTSAQVLIEDSTAKDTPVIIDLISPTNDLPPSPPPSQPTSQVQDLLHHPSLPTPETTSSRLSDMVASLTSQPDPDPGGVIQSEHSKTHTPPSIPKPPTDHMIPALDQENQLNLENNSDAAAAITTQKLAASMQTEQLKPPEHTSGPAQPDSTTKTAQASSTHQSSERAQDPRVEDRTSQLSPETAQALIQRLQETKGGFRTKHSYYTPLSQIESHLNAPSQGAHAIDIIGVATDTTSEPVRAKKGPKDFSILMHITDFSRHPDPVQVQILRPYKLSLPIADIGDVVLLRNFVVKSQKRQCYLLSAEASAWVVWRHKKVHRNGVNGDGAKPAWARKAAVQQHDVMRDECNGPPVEFGDEEYKHAVTLRDWWQHVDDGSFEANKADMSNGNHLVAV